MDNIQHDYKLHCATWAIDMQPIARIATDGEFIRLFGVDGSLLYAKLKPINLEHWNEPIHVTI